MIKRTFRKAILPAHSVALDELGRVCSTISERFGDGEEVKTTIILLTKERNVRAIAFESVSDMLENKDNIIDDIGAYSLEFEGFDDVHGLKTLKIYPPFFNNLFQLRSEAVAFSRSDGWCAGIIETTLVEFRRIRTKFGWFYNTWISAPILILSAFTMGVLSRTQESPSILEIALIALCGVCVALIGWFVYGGPMRVKSAQVRIGKAKQRNWPAKLALALMVLQLLVGIAGLYLGFGGR